MALTIAFAQVVTVVPVHAEEGGEEPVIHEADTSKWLVENDLHYNPCVVEGCPEKFNEEYHSDDWYDANFTGYDEEGHTWKCNVCDVELSSEHYYSMTEAVGHGCICGFWLEHADSDGDGYCDLDTNICTRHLIHSFGNWEFKSDEDGDYCIRICEAEDCNMFDVSYHGKIQCRACGWKPETSSKPDTKPVETEPQKTNEEVISEALAQATEETIRTEEAMPVTSFTSTDAVNTLPVEVKETSATETVYNLSKITTTRGFISAVDKIVKAKTTTDAVTFYSSKAIAFNADSLTALTNANTEFVYMFNHEGHLYKVTIPVGAKVDLAGQTFAGPLYIGAQLGTSVLVK